MDPEWETTRVSSVGELADILIGLGGRGWLFRGHPTSYGSLIPSIDRPPLDVLARVEKLKLERQSIDTFRAAAKYFAHDGEAAAMADDLIALMVLRHYDVPTRLLDWSGSGLVAAYFAACAHPTCEGEIWAFDRPYYQNEGVKQWRRWPETTLNGSGNPEDFAPQLTAFLPDVPSDYWFVCLFYQRPGFPRQLAQHGAFSMTANFSEDHAPHIARLMGDKARFHRLMIPAAIKSELVAFLREHHGLWRGALYPDSAGAAQTAAALFPVAL